MRVLFSPPALSIYCSVWQSRVMYWAPPLQYCLAFTWVCGVPSAGRWTRCSLSSGGLVPSGSGCLELSWRETQSQMCLHYFFPLIMNKQRENFMLLMSKGSPRASIWHFLLGDISIICPPWWDFSLADEKKQSCLKQPETSLWRQIVWFCLVCVLGIQRGTLLAELSWRKPPMLLMHNWHFKNIWLNE